MSVCIVASGLGNVAAVANMLEFVGIDAIVSDQPATIRASQKLILPGVGAFDAGMARLKATGLGDAVVEAVRERGASVLGICLGMQLLGTGSEEGAMAGLGLVDAPVVRLNPAEGTVPHVGWSDIQVRGDDPLFAGLKDGARFYFVHSYVMQPSNPEVVVATFARAEPRCCAVRSGRVMGVQFHPEKSHSFGMKLFRNFASMSETRPRP